MQRGPEISAVNLPYMVGIAGAGIAVLALVFIVSRFVVAGEVPANHMALHVPVQLCMRAAFLLISVGALLHLRMPMTVPWRWAVGAALLVLGGGIAGDLMGIFARADWMLRVDLRLGAMDSLERRLFRLGAMAAYAVPMLVLLAASEPVPRRATKSQRLPTRIADLLVRWEPVLFAIGAVTLASFLMAAALVDREFTWLAPIGADTTTAACVAAAIRARRRADSFAWVSWLVVCCGLAIGLLMGIYSFGGPIPTPAFIGDYSDLVRTILRDTHISLMATGMAGVAISVARKAMRASS